MADRQTNTLVLAHMWVAFIAFIAAAFLGFYQVLERSGLVPGIESYTLYFGSVSTHGVLMAFVLTTFFIMGFGYYTAATSLKRAVWARPLAWLGFWTAVIGVLMAAWALLTGRASVLYTFYPPLLAHWAFYIGAALLIVGSLFWVFIMIVMMAQWKRENPGQPVPLPMFATTANALLWAWTVVGVVAEVVFQLIPLALGWVDTVDAGLARTLFAWTLHPIVYFWLLPAYIALYTLVPRVAGGRLFSDEMARVAFVMLLIFSLPIGFHHLYMDPEQAAGWKLLHAFGTFLVATPTLLTAFTVTASLEIAGRLRGGRGIFGWLGALPWREPMVTAAFLGLILLGFGGFGGVVNASYSMNAMVHNTAWVPGHFHLMFGGMVIMMYMAIAYYLWPKMTGRRLASRGMALTQLWLWFIGMLVTTFPWHVVGLLGQPRRISAITYDTPLLKEWAPYEVIMVIGGGILLLSAILFIWTLLRTHGGEEEADREVAYAEPVHPVLSLPRALNGFALWNWILLFYMALDFGYPILQFFIMKTYDPSPWGI
ncbi:MAG: cytochrome C oxidase subunit I [Gammaproteobacteria bacterium]|nr:MAG: cytochrome C oxidase subunit I [Gammaproteobacteria bacterium]